MLCRISVTCMSIRRIQQYHAKVDKIIRYGGSRNESALRKPFQDLLEAYASSKDLLLVTEVEVRTRVGPVSTRARKP